MIEARPLVIVAVLLALGATALGASTDAPASIRIGDMSFATLADALAAAQPGDVIDVVGGVHEGAFVVEKPLTLRGSDGARIVGPGIGTVLAIEADNVTVAGLHVEGSGSRHDIGDSAIKVTADNVTISGNVVTRSLFGIWVGEAAHARIENNSIVGDPAYEEARRGDGIRLWYSPYAVVRNNTLHGTRDLIGWYSRDLLVEDNKITDARYGLHLMYCSDARILRNDIDDSSVGIYTMSSSRVEIAENAIHGSRGTSGYGIAFKDADDVETHHNILADNAVGVYLDTTPFRPDGTARFAYNAIVTNDVGVLLLPAVARNLFEENTFWDNLEHVGIHGGHASGANTWIRNYWSGFAGFDADGDGYSESPYRAQRLFEKMQDQDPRLRALAHSPLADALEAAANAFPIVRPEPKLEDAQPRTSPHPLPIASPPALAPPSSGAGGLVIAGGILAALALLGTRMRSTPMPSPAPEKPALRVRCLSAGYGATPILADIDVELRAGEAVALWGENGAGKTTLLKAILGLVPHEGSVEVLGADSKKDGRVARSRIGYVPQEIRLEDARVREVMRTYAALRGARRSDADALLARLGLQAHASKRTSELSGGLRQRLGLALALLGDPPLLLLDEPTANLDAGARQAYLDELRRLMAEGKAILFTSHRTDEVAALAARVTILHHTRQQTLHAQRFLDDRKAGVPV